MKQRKIIRILIGSALDELKLERAKLMSFIQGLNNKYHERGIFIEGYICEETPNSMRLGGSQKLHNDYISGGADATIFMFFHKAGEFTMKELELARQAFLKKGKPNVYVFFKAVDGTTDANDNIQKAVSLVFNDYGHYYKMFDDVDTVKLELLQFLMDKLPGKGELVIKDGAVYMNGELINDISAANIFAYQNNPNIKRLKERIAMLLMKMTEASASGNAREALRISAELGEVQQEYHELESALLKQIMYFHKLNRKNEKPDQRRLEALRLLELGDSRAVQYLITQDETDDRSRVQDMRWELAAESLLNEDKNLIEDIRIRIMAMEADIENNNRFSEIEHAYESAYNASVRVKDFDSLCEYAYFLYKQNNYPKAISVAEKMRWMLEEKANCIDVDKAWILSLLAGLYAANLDATKAEALYMELLSILRETTKLEPTIENEAILADTCDGAAVLYLNCGKNDLAQALLNEALSIYQQLLKKTGKERYEYCIASIYHQLASVQRRKSQIGRAEELLLKSLSICRELNKKGMVEEYASCLAIVCEDLADILLGQNRLTEAEKLYEDALCICRRLANEVNRVAYEPDLAACCRSITSLLREKRFATDLFDMETKKQLDIRVEKLLTEAYSIYKRFFDEISKTAFGNRLSAVCIDLADFYRVDKPETAEQYYLEALSVRKALSNINREQYGQSVADSLQLYAKFYQSKREYDRANQMLKEALMIRREFAERENSIDNMKALANILCELGYYNIYRDKKESDKCLDEAKSIAESLKKGDEESQRISDDIFGKVKSVNKSHGLLHDIQIMRILNRSKKTDRMISEIDDELDKILDEETIEDIKFGNHVHAARRNISERNFDEAETNYLSALKGLKDLKGRDASHKYDKDYVDVCCQTAKLYAGLGREADAAAMLNDALNTLKSMERGICNGSEGIRLDKAYSYIASCCFEIGCLEESELYYRKALVLKRENADRLKGVACDPCLAEICREYGMLSVENGNYELAESLYNESLSALCTLTRIRGLQGAFNCDVAKTMNSLAKLYLLTNKRKAAVIFFKSAIKRCKPFLNRYSDSYTEEITEAYSGLAECYAKNGKKRNAEICFHRELNIYRRMKHSLYDTMLKDRFAKACNRIAAYYQGDGNPKKAVDLYLEAYQVYKEISFKSDDHILKKPNRGVYESELGTTCCRLGAALSESGRIEEADTRFREGLLILRRRVAIANEESSEPELAAALYEAGVFYKNACANSTGDNKIYYTQMEEECFAEALKIASRYRSIVPACQSIWDALS